MATLLIPSKPCPWDHSVGYGGERPVVFDAALIPWVMVFQLIPISDSCWANRRSNSNGDRWGSGLQLRLRVCSKQTKDYDTVLNWVPIGHD